MSSLLWMGSLQADTEIADSSEESQERIPVGSRRSDREKRERMQTQRILEREAEDANHGENQMGLKRAHYKLTEQDRPFKLAPRAWAAPQLVLAAIPVNCHWLAGIADNLKSVELEDGSIWETASGDTYVLKYWRRDDALVITPVYSWLSSFDYYITNKSNNTYIRANLVGSPIAFGPHSHWIVGIDPYQGHVLLENQTVWCVNSSDTYLLKDWRPNDHVITGAYDSFFTSFDHILINVNMDEHIRAKQY